MAQMKPTRKSASGMNTQGGRASILPGMQSGIKPTRKAADTKQGDPSAAKAAYNRTPAGVSPANHNISRSSGDASQPYGGKPSKANKKGVD